MGRHHLLLQRVQRPLHSRTQLDGFGVATGSDMWEVCVAGLVYMGCVKDLHTGWNGRSFDT
jgi:hypothetical protein